MKTNVKINLTDDERRMLADKVDRKKTKRMITRAEVTRLCIRYINLLLGGKDRTSKQFYNPSIGENLLNLPDHHPHDPYSPDAEDIEHLSGRSRGHIYGFNKVKNQKRNWD